MSTKNKKSKEKIVTVQSTSSSGLPKWKQSPINLSSVTAWSKKFPTLLLNGHWVKEGIATMTNTGRTVKIEIGGDRKAPFIKGGPLMDKEYELLNVQFRWGTENCRGAEHSIDNIWYSMEAQIIHWNTQYGSVERCYDKPDGIAIISYFMQVVGCPGLPDNPNFAKITDYLPAIKKMGTSVNINPDCLSWMIEACCPPGYYTYSGSLTTSPYSECVMWIIIPKLIEISAHQIDAFRSIYDNKWEPLAKSYRPQQNVRGRRVFYAARSTTL